MKARTGILSFAFAWLLGCQGRQSALDPAGPQSGRIHSLTQMFVWISGLVFILVLAFLLYALWRGRKNTDRTPGEIREQKRAAWVVAVSTVITTLILTGYLINSVAKGRAISTMPDKTKTLEIDAIGHQWWWEFHYANPSAQARVMTANEIHVPVGRPVRVITTSRDVIHSFWVPNLHGKTDMIPNHENVTWIQADRPGVYRGQCAEYCGLQHAHMAFLVVAEPEKDFDAWIGQQRQPALAPANADLQRGQQVFLSGPCVICHRIRGTSALGQAAPDLTHFGSRHAIAAATVPNTAGYLAGWITDSQHLKPGNRMPPVSLEPRDMQSLLNYLESLK
jgi:cytochrome c oxidase subunit 2